MARGHPTTNTAPLPPLIVKLDVPLEHRLTSLEVRNDDFARMLAAQESNHTHLEIIVTLFGILITVIVIYFAFRTERGAIRAAVGAAKEEMISSRSEIDSCLANVKASEENAKAILLEIEGHKKVAASDARTIRANRDQVVNDPKFSGLGKERNDG